MSSESAQPLEVTLDIAATVSAILWPVAVFVLLFLFRERLPVLARELAGRVSKVDIAGITLEFARAKEFQPVLSGGDGAVDFRRSATALQISDSTAETFITQLRDPTDAEYAIVNLGMGNEWLTSRLYIMAVVFARMKGLRAFVFLQQSGTSRSYLGWADPDRVRWALARKYPWLEAAYANAYSNVTGAANQPALVTSFTGRLGFENDPGDPGPSIELIKAFLRRIQWPAEAGTDASTAPAQPPQNPLDWVPLNDANNTSEHATYVTSTLLEEILGDELNFSYVAHELLQTESRRDQVRLVIAQSGRYVAVTQDALRFYYLVDRARLLEQVA